MVIQRAEIKIAVFISEHIIAFLAADHLPGLLQECFPDSEIAKGISTKRTKTTAIIKNVIGSSAKEELIESLKNNKFRVLTDESTDIGTVKTCVTVSSKRLAAFSQFQKFMEVEPHRMLPSQTRWLSLNMVVSRILEQWDALKLYFTDTWINQRLLSTEEIFKIVHNMVFICRFNQYFQTERVVITNLHKMIISLFQEIFFLKREYVTKTKLSAINPKMDKFQLIDRQLYLGAKVMSHIDEQNVIANNVCRKYFFERCRLFLQTAACEIQKRYNMDDIILSKLSTLKPKNVFSLEYRDVQPSLIPLIKVVPYIVSNDDTIQLIDDQWRRLPLLLSKISDEESFLKLPIDEFC
ncbi:Dimer Tnp hAT domain-containing protein [Aphis craccivora]|uniref:Dimer Tnp hAT domain-containing protein n=1 Tax=Aphis craccivora TaxID=307492 RepID=A0A6G0Y4W9_APHCR|nr:Dimer Tnp hAT domain-containing protein [Aphis craccivora]